MPSMTQMLEKCATYHRQGRPHSQSLGGRVVRWCGHGGRDGAVLRCGEGRDRSRCRPLRKVSAGARRAESLCTGRLADSLSASAQERDHLSARAAGAQTPAHQDSARSCRQGLIKESALSAAAPSSCGCLANQSSPASGNTGKIRRPTVTSACPEARACGLLFGARAGRAERLYGPPGCTAGAERVHRPARVHFSHPPAGRFMAAPA